MANKRISELNSASSISVDDLLVLVNELQTRKTTLQDLITFLTTQGDLVQLDNGTIPEDQLPDLTTTNVAEGTNKYYTAARVLSEVLAGFSTQDTAVISSDSVLSALGKLQGQLNNKQSISEKGTGNGYASLENGKVPVGQLPASVVGGVSYQGSWDAASALPAASSSNKGWYYVVSANGTQSIDGNSEWKISDWIISNGTVWQKIDNSDPGIYEALTGYADAPAGTAITGTDTVLTAFGKIQAQLHDRQLKSEKGTGNGYASLVSGVVPAAQLPGFMFYKGTWNAAVALPAASTSTGWYYVISANGSYSVDGNSEWKIGDWVVSNGTLWQKIDNTDPGILEALTGYTVGANSALSATDTILEAFRKTQGQLNDKQSISEKGTGNGYASLVDGVVPVGQLPGFMLYKGTWNAAGALLMANPANKGWYYVVNANGSYSMDGISEWKIGDWIVSNGAAWQKIDNSDPGIGAVLSGFVTGANSNVLNSDTILSGMQKLQGQVTARESLSNKGAASGYASLDANTRLPKAQLTRGSRAYYLDTSQGVVGASETKVFSTPINGAVFTTGEQLNITAWFSASPSANAKTIKLYMNSLDTLTGATHIGTFILPSTHGSVKFERQITFHTTTTIKAGCAPATSSQNGESTGLDSTISTPSISSLMYIMLSGTKAVSGDTFRVERVAVEALFKSPLDAISG